METLPVGSIGIELGREGGVLRVRFIIEGDVERIFWPDEAAPDRTDELWRRTCFEAFVRTPDGYREYNVSPSGEWASYRFDGYRTGMMAAAERAALRGMAEAKDVMMLDVGIELPPEASGPLGLSAVIEDTDGGVSYWALAHPSDKPDFHHPDSFGLTLPAVEPS